MNAFQHIASNRSKRTARTGKALVFVVLCLPMVFGMLGLVIDGSLLMNKQRELQTIADAAAPAAAHQLSQGKSVSEATQTAVDLVQQHDGLSDATVTVNHPPQEGAFAGNSGYVEVIISQSVESIFQRVFSGDSTKTVRSRAVAGREVSTSGSAIVVLDPDPDLFTITGLPLGLPALSLPATQLGGLEILGSGQLDVQGSVFVNTNWAGQDENGDPVGEPAPLGGLQSALSCTPIVGLNKLLATDIRVVGGVDDPSRYGPVDAGEPSPLLANKAPVPDPNASLPVPTLASDGGNVDATTRGHVNILSVPLLGSPVTLEPGVYESINIVAGRVVFQPGIYVIRGRNSATQISLAIVAGEVTADGVMFYITDTTTYSVNDGLPDATDGTTAPASLGVSSVIPSVVINAQVAGSRFSGLNDAASPFDGMLLFQRRNDRRPIVLFADPLLGSANLSGSIYAKWGQLVFAAGGTYDMKLAVGNARIINARDLTLEPSQLFEPARDVYLVE